MSGDKLCNSVKWSQTPQGMHHLHVHSITVKFKGLPYTHTHTHTKESSIQLQLKQYLQTVSVVHSLI